MDVPEGTTTDELLLDISPRSRVTVRAVLTEDFNDGADESPSILNQAFMQNRPPRRRRKRRAYYSSTSEESDSSSTTDTSGSLSSFDSELAAKGRAALALTGDNVDVDCEVAPSTSRPRRKVVQLAEARKRRNQLLGKERISRRCRRLPPLVTIDSSSSDNEETKRKLEQEKADYQLALKVSSEWNKAPADCLEVNSNLNGKVKLKCNASEEDDCDQNCVICFEKSVDPVGCIYCQQLLGCRACIMRWRRTNNISRLNRSSPLSEGISSTNHRTCPLCRVEWEDVPEVAPWEDFLVEKALKLK